jgi:hypothetical protein
MACRIFSVGLVTVSLRKSDILFIVDLLRRHYMRMPGDRQSGNGTGLY